MKVHIVCCKTRQLLCRRALVIKSWADAHANLPIRARWFAKADVALRSNEAEAKSALQSGGFFYVPNRHS